MGRRWFQAKVSGSSQEVVFTLDSEKAIITSDVELFYRYSLLEGTNCMSKRKEEKERAGPKPRAPLERAH